MAGPARAGIVGAVALVLLVGACSRATKSASVAELPVRPAEVGSAGTGSAAVSSRAPVDVDPLRYSPPPEKHEIRIDAISGAVSGGRRAPSGQRTRVTLYNINPFLFQYRMTGTAVPVVETAQLDFFRAAFNVALPDVAKGPQATELFKSLAAFDFMKAVPVVEKPKVGCPSSNPSAEADYTEALLQKDKLVSLKSEIEVGFVEAVELLGGLDTVLAAAARPIYVEASPAADVYRAVLASIPLANGLARAADSVGKQLKPRVATFAGATKAYVEFTAPLVLRHPGCTGFVKLRDYNNGFLVDSAVFRTNLATIAEAATKVTTLAEGLVRVTKEPKYFYRTEHVGEFDEPQEVTIVVDRRAIGPDTTHRRVVNTKLDFGGARRLAIGAGFAFSNLAINKFDPVTVLATPSDARPGDTLQTRVGVSESSSRRISPMLVLSTRLISNRLVLTDYISALHAVLGATIRSQSGDTNVEYFFGPGVSAFNNYVFLSGGWYVGRVLELDAVSPDDRLPNGGKVPVVSRTDRKAAFMISFRLR